LDTNKQTDKHTDKPNLYIDINLRELKSFQYRILKIETSGNELFSANIKTEEFLSGFSNYLYL